jgi:hypothetical protein
VLVGQAVTVLKTSVRVICGVWVGVCEASGVSVPTIVGTNVAVSEGRGVGVSCGVYVPITTVLVGSSVSVANGVICEVGVQIRNPAPGIYFTVMFVLEIDISIP